MNRLIDSFVSVFDGLFNLWPKIVMTSNEMFTLQVGLETFQGDLTIQWDLILAMTVLTALPNTFVFGFLQKYIMTGIATTGLK